MDFKGHLNEALLSNKVVLVYTNQKDVESFSAGVPVFFLNEWVVLRSINPDGFFDGYLFKKVSDIYKVELDDEYANRLEVLFGFRKGEVFVLNKYETLKEILQSVEKKFVSVMDYNDECFFGEILDVKVDSVKLQLYDFYANKEDIVSLSYESIKSMNVGGIEESSLEFLLSKMI